MELVLYAYDDSSVSQNMIGWIGYALEWWLSDHGFKLGWEWNWNFIF